MKITAIIQARMGSTRLPGKVMMKIKDKTVIQHVIERVRNAKLINDVIVATTTNIRDNPIEYEAKKLNAKCFRGSENNVLSRYYLAALKNKSDIILRITSDCPLIDSKLMDSMIDKFLLYYRNNDVDYMSNFDVVENTFPRGMDIEIFTFETLEKAYKNSTKDYEKEHVTPYMYKENTDFKIKGFKNKVNLSQYRLTLDTIEDFKAISAIYNYLYDDNQLFGMEDIVNILIKYNYISKINENIKQKKY